jgi:opacity protein-like surface antigen
MKITCLAALLVMAMPALAQPPEPRGGSNDFSLGLMAIGSRHIAFEGGATARNEGGVGFALSVARNLSDYFAVGAEATFSRFDYRAGVAPGSGNAAAGFEANGTLETIGLRLNGTWHLLRGPVTPFLTAGFGVNFIDAELDRAPPSGACWIHPWYGQACGSVPTSTLTRLGYSAGAGLRVDLPARQGFLRLLVGGDWLDISEATSHAGWVQLRADFGLFF